MQRLIAIILLSFVFSSDVMAQRLSGSSQNENNRIVAGVKLGANMPRMYYTNQHLKDLPHDFMIGPSLGVFVEFPVLKYVSFATEINYQKRGGATSYIYEHDYNVNYDIQTYYASLRVPFYFYYPIKRKVNPYLSVGPDLGYATGGTISLSQPGLDIPESSMNINKSNYNRFYFGIILGVGLRHRIDLTNYSWIIKYDVAINWGLTDTFSQSEHEGTGSPTNIHAYNHQGERFSRGLEVGISIGVKRNVDMSACRKFH